MAQGGRSLEDLVDDEMSARRYEEQSPAIKKLRTKSTPLTCRSRMNAEPEVLWSCRSGGKVKQRWAKYTP